MDEIIATLIDKLKLVDLPSDAQGEWIWINDNLRKGYIESIYQKKFHRLSEYLKEPLALEVAYGIITPIIDSSSNSPAKNHFMKDIEMIRETYGTEGLMALEHEIMFKHEYAVHSADFKTYPDSPRHYDSARRILAITDGFDIGVEIGGGMGD